MITDRLNTFALDVAMNTGAAGSYLIGDVIPLLYTPRDIGQGQPLYLVIQVSELATSAGSATASFALVSDAQPAIATDGSATVHVQTATFPVAQLIVTKSLLIAALPLEGPAYEGYLGILQTTGVAAFTAGKIDAFLTPVPATYRAYPDGKH